MALPNPLPITPLPGPFDLNVDFLPGSKSLTNRALLLAALAEGTSQLTNVLFADDTRRMMEALRALGFRLDIDEPAKAVTVHGNGGRIPARQADLFLGNAGTAMRFLTAALCLGDPGSIYTLRGIPRMHQRPIGQLVQPLRQLGAKIDCLERDGCPPLRITAGGLAGGLVRLDPSISSQFVSALMQVGPCMRSPLTLEFTSQPVSFPYIDMTARLMEFFGPITEWQFDRDEADVPARISIDPGQYQSQSGSIEPDASNASYFFAAAAITQSAIRIDGLKGQSLQGDSDFAEICLRSAGAHVHCDPNGDHIEVRGAPTVVGQDVDLDPMPDMAQTLAVVALFADGPTVIRNVGNLRVKETDRIAALQNELTQLGAIVTVEGDDIKIVPPKGNILRHPDGIVIDESHPVVIDTYDDHRMAMSFAVAGLRQAGIRIADPACVNKTYPEFFEHLNRLHLAAEKGTAR